jgi:hypothetical protein
VKDSEGMCIIFFIIARRNCSEGALRRCVDHWKEEGTVVKRFLRSDNNEIKVTIRKNAAP